MKQAQLFRLNSSFIIINGSLNSLYVSNTRHCDKNAITANGLKVAKFRLQFLHYGLQITDYGSKISSISLYGLTYLGQPYKNVARILKIKNILTRKNTEIRFCHFKKSIFYNNVKALITSHQDPIVDVCLLGNGVIFY